MEREMAKKKKLNGNDFIIKDLPEGNFVKLGGIKNKMRGINYMIDTDDLPTHGDNEEPANLSWLFNLSAASLFGNSQTSSATKPYDPRLAFENCQNLKPGLTYTELIEKALKEKGELTVSEIYKWIYSNYPYYKKNDGRWKNSIRHNLSINPQFRKGERCNNGGHFWALNKEYDDEFKKWQELKKGSREDRKRKIMLRREEDELEIATRSIMLEENSNDSTSYTPNNDPTLMRVASDILSGIDHQVEVEYMDKANCVSAPIVIEEDMFESSDPILSDPVLFSDCLELGFQPYELIDSRL